jgi:hypothetical protein
MTEHWAKFKHTMKLTLFLILIILTNRCYSQTDPANPMISFEKDNYKFQYPKSWRLDTLTKLGPELFVFSPLENESDRFSENVNISVQNLGGQNIDLSQYKQITDKQVTDLATDSKIFESSIVKTNKGEFFRITYAMTQGKFRLKLTTVCFISNDKAHLATFSAELDKYDNYKKIGEQILNSFSLIK